MDDKTESKPEDKPFSVLERFRQLKKDKEQVSVPAHPEPVKTENNSGTIFSASSSASSSTINPSTNGDFRKGENTINCFGKRRGKRNFQENSPDRPSKRISGDVLRGQKEQDVGITEFIRNGPGFDAIVKHRYTDFHVNEIDKDGNVVKFTSNEIPKRDVGETLTEEEDPTILSPEQWDALREVVDKQLSTTVDKDVTDLSKEERQKIHKAMKRRFGVYVYSNTNIIGDRKIMQIGYAKNNREGNTRFCVWPKERPEYLHFILLKENCDTTEAINVISKFTNLKITKFGYAGTKDKRAVTTQQMCARRVEASRFARCTTLRGIFLGNFCYKWSNLRLGDLSGNRFRIVLRNVKASDEVIKEAVESLQKNGFINYFGMQRFGQSALVPTYEIGKAILKGDWKLATELLLKPRPGESTYRDLMEAREIWWKTRCATQALVPLTRKDKTIEGKILQGLKKHGPNAYQNAFDGLPRNTVMLYLHSYQSLIWNKVVSRRIKMFGLKVIPGDLVIDDPIAAADLDTKWQDNINDSEDSDSESDEKECGRIQVRSLTAEEAESASMYDVVYPLPGFDIKFPENEIAQWYIDMLKEDGHSIDCFKNLNRKYGMYGTYRKILGTVDDFTWSTLQYSSSDEDLLLTDIDVFRGKPPPKLDPNGPFKAVIVEFNLKVCSFATMAIRELTKRDSSFVSQALLTNQAREECLANRKLKEEESTKMEVDIGIENGEVSDNKSNCHTNDSEEISESNATEENTQKVVETETENNKEGSMTRENEEILERNVVDENIKKEKMETETEIKNEKEMTSETDEHETSSQHQNVDIDDESEMNKREAEADNIINKYLERNFH